TVEGLGATATGELGFSASLQSAENLTVQVNTQLEISFGGRANVSGVEEVIRALGLLSNLEYPDAVTDVPVEADFDAVIRAAESLLNRATQTIRVTQTDLSRQMDLMKGVQESHRQEIDLLTTLTDKEENVDTMEAVTLL